MVSSIPRTPIRGGALHVYAVVTAAATFLLILAGGTVTSTGSGLAVPDWPLSYGRFFPPMVGGVLYEHGHRMIAGTVGLMVAILAFTLGPREERVWVRGLAYGALGAIVLQALLGGITVLMRLPPAVSIGHACLAQAIFSALVVVAVATSPERVRSPSESPGGARRSAFLFCAIAAGAIYVQLILGAMLRHTGKGLIVHVLGAVTVAALVGVSTTRLRRIEPGLAGLRVSHILLGIQLLLGILAWRGVWRAGIATAHVGVGALLLAIMVSLALPPLLERSEGELQPSPDMAAS